MSDANPQPPKVDEILRLSTALAEQMLEAQVMGQPIPTQKFTALVGAARFLKDNNMAWPPLVGIHPAWAAGVLFRRAAVDVDEVTETFDTKV